MSKKSEKAIEEVLIVVKEKGQEFDDVEYEEYLSDLIYELEVKHDDFQLGSQKR